MKKANETTQAVISYLLIAKNTDFLKSEIVDTMEDFVKNKNSEVGYLTTIFVYGNSTKDIISSIEEKVEALKDLPSLNGEETELLVDLQKLYEMIFNLRKPIPDSLKEEKSLYDINKDNSIFLTGLVDEETIREIQSTIEGKVEA